MLTRTACTPCCSRFFRELPGDVSSATDATSNNATDVSCGMCLRCPFTTTADAGAVGHESCVCTPGYVRPQLLDEDVDLEDENMTNSTDGDFNETNITDIDFNETNATDMDFDATDATDNDTDTEVGSGVGGNATGGGENVTMQRNASGTSSMAGNGTAPAPPRTGPCIPCPPGASSDTRNASACTLCPNNTYQEEGASAACLACPRGSSSMEGAAFRTNCTCDDGEIGPPGGPCGPLYGIAPHGRLSSTSHYTRAAALEWVVQGSMDEERNVTVSMQLLVSGRMLAEAAGGLVSVQAASCSDETCAEVQLPLFSKAVD